MATRKTTTRKKTVEKPAIVIDEDIEVGMLELPDSKGIRVALIRSAGKCHWDQPYEEPAATPTSREDIQAAITETQAALEHLKHCLKQDKQEANIDQQLSLFEKLKKSMQ